MSWMSSEISPGSVTERRFPCLSFITASISWPCTRTRTRGTNYGLGFPHQKIKCCPPSKVQTKASGVNDENDKHIDPTMGIRFFFELQISPNCSVSHGFSPQEACFGDETSLVLNGTKIHVCRPGTMANNDRTGTLTEPQPTDHNSLRQSPYRSLSNQLAE